MDNGAIVASPLTVPVLMNAIAKANEHATKKTGPRMRITDVYDDEPSEDDEYVEDISATTDVDDEDDDYDDYE